MNQAPVAAELERVFALGPTEVIDDIIHGDAGNCGPSFCRGVIQEAEIHVVTRPNSPLGKALPDVSVTDIINQVWGDRPGVTRGQSFAIVLRDVPRPLSRKLLHIVRNILLEITANEDAVLVGGNEVDSCNRGIQTLWVW